MTYDTLDWNSRRTSQVAFLALARKGDVYFDSDSEAEPQWKMKMVEHAARLREMASELTFLPTPKFAEKGAALL